MNNLFTNPTFENVLEDFRSEIEASQTGGPRPGANEGDYESYESLLNDLDNHVWSDGVEIEFLAYVSFKIETIADLNN